MSVVFNHDYNVAFYLVLAFENDDILAALR
jgi:hypothetical protein